MSRTDFSSEFVLSFSILICILACDMMNHFQWLYNIVGLLCSICCCCCCLLFLKLGRNMPSFEMICKIEKEIAFYWNTLYTIQSFHIKFLCRKSYIFFIPFIFLCVFVPIFFCWRIPNLNFVLISITILSLYWL